LRRFSKSAVSTWSTAAICALFIVAFGVYVTAEERVNRANEQRITSFELSDELRQSSDDLTRMARTYVATGNPIYKQHYLEILAIRDGKSPRPVNYNHVYWDLVLNDDARPRSFGQAISILDLMRQAGFTAKEFRHLQSAKAASDWLTSTELTAMALVESTTPPTDANRNTARQMLDDADYHQAKRHIMRQIGESVDLVDQLTLSTVDDAKLNLGRTRLVFIVLGVSLVFMLARTLYLINAETKEKEQGHLLLKSAEAALRKSEQRFRQTFENNAAVLLLIEPDSGAIVDANPAAASFYGYSVEQLRVMRIDQINTSTPSEIAAEMARAVKQERHCFIFSHSLTSGEIRTVEVRSTPITIDARILLFSIVSDVTEHQRAQQALERNEKLLRESQEAARIGSYINTLEAGTFESTSILDEILGITKEYPHTHVMDQRDPYTAGHQQRVGEIAGAIAAEMGLDADTQRGLRVAGAVHDIGKISVPTEILGKPGRISAIEMAIIKTHAQEGYEILKGIDFPRPVAEVVRQHHECIDGSGYPRGLKGDEIVLEARVLAVADVVEAMASDRPYRPGIGIDKALAEIERGRGTAYDANAVDACLRLFREKGYSILAQAGPMRLEWSRGLSSNWTENPEILMSWILQISHFENQPQVGEHKNPGEMGWSIKVAMACQIQTSGCWLAENTCFPPDHDALPNLD